MKMTCKALGCRRLAALALFLPAVFAQAQTPAITPDISGKEFVVPKQDFDYDKRVVMVPMRDGVKLYTVIVVPKGAKNAPMLLTRTPYDAAGRAQRMESPRMIDILPQGDEVFVRAGYIRVFQDVRGKYGSQGDYVMTRPLRGPLKLQPRSIMPPTPGTPSSGWSSTCPSPTGASACSALPMKASPW